jgi:tRNA A37 N6-isopentenylltransferase MiaA
MTSEHHVRPAYLDQQPIVQAAQQIKLATRQYAKPAHVVYRDQRIHWLDATTALTVDTALALLRSSPE